MSITPDPLLVSHGLRNRLSKSDAHVLYRMMVVDVQIALCVDANVDQSMTRNLVEHVVEKSDAGLKLGLARTIEIDADGDLGLFGVAGNFADAG